MPKSKKITLLLVEHDHQIDLSIHYDGIEVLKVDKKIEKLPRVNGFNQARISQERLLEISHQETTNDEFSSQIGFIREFSKSQERSITYNIKELQKTIRKIIIEAESKNIADQLIEQLIKQNKQQLINTTINPFEKKQHPWAKCMDCHEFYIAPPDDNICLSCGGFVKRELRPNTWFECQVCQGTGYDARFKKVCTSCDQKGWIFAELFKL